MQSDLDSFSGPRLVDRLQSARYILASVESPALTGSSDARSVALAIIHCQDASELVLSAIAEQSGIVLNRRDGFEDLLKKLIEKAKDDGKQSISRHERFLRDLNEKRIAFKHYGALPDVGQNNQVVFQTSERLSNICEDFCGVTLSNIDISVLIKDGPTRIHLRNARTHHSRGQFREVFECVSMAINRASRCLFSMDIEVGDASTKSALMLSGYGINPASYVSLQRLLPSRHPARAGCSKQFWWNRRLFGHEANWTCKNAQFAIETSSDVILRLQNARPIAETREHRYSFHDLITITSDSPTVFAYDAEDEGKELEPVDVAGKFRRGDAFLCWASTVKKVGGTSRKIRDLEDLDEWVVAFDVQSVSSTPSVISEIGTLYFRKDDVSITDQQDDMEVLYQWTEDAWLDEDQPSLVDAIEP